MNVGLIAAVVHEVLQTEKFESLGDLAEAVKGRCARLKVPYDGGGVSDALRMVARSRPLLGVTPIRGITPIERLDDTPPLSRADAEATLARVYAGLARHETGGRDVHR